MGNEFTQDWDKFLKEAQEVEKEAEREAEMDESRPTPIQSSNVVTLNDAQIRMLCERLSGKRSDGNPKAELEYISYIDNNLGSAATTEEPTPLPEDVVAYIVPHPQFKEFYMLDLVFSSAESLELKRMWATLEVHKQDVIKAQGTQVPVFFVNIRENLTENEIKQREEMLVCGVMNPLLYYLTRTNPSEQVPEVTSEMGEIIGGNILRMLVHTDALTFQVIDEETALIIKDAELPVDTSIPVHEEVDLERDDMDGLVIPPGYYDMDGDNK